MTDDMLSKRDLIIGTAIAVVMTIAFTRLSSGLSLVVTFVPGMAVTWLAFAWLYRTKTKRPQGPEFFPVFFATLAVQFIHFAEEFTTGFAARFPQLYGGTPYSDNLFVSVNMVAYGFMTLSCILVFTFGLKWLLIPSLFFIVYGAIGNAISHTWWSVYEQAYFPGLVTAQFYWIAGPFLLWKLLRRPKAVFAVVTLFALVLIPSLTFFASVGGGK